MWNSRYNRNQRDKRRPTRTITRTGEGVYATMLWSAACGANAFIGPDPGSPKRNGRERENDA